MPGRTLGKTEIVRLTALVKEPVDWSRQSDVQPILAKAFKEGANEVELRMGTFKIRYFADGKAWVQITHGFAPCGWFDTQEYVRSHGQTT